MNQESFWNQQKNSQWKTLTNPLKNDSQLHSQLNNFITTFYWKFLKKQKKDSYPEVKFLGFSGFEDYPEENKMGHCKFDANQSVKVAYTNGQETGKTVKLDIKLNISLSQKLLLNKLGMDKWFASENSFYTVSFDNLINTIAHELAHAYQQTVNNFEWGEERSHCESSGDKERYPELVAEHTRLTNEIESLIKSSSEYQKFKVYWKEGKGGLEEMLIEEDSSFISDERNNKIGDTSSKIGKNGEEKVDGLEKVTDKWPSWVLPAGIGLGVVLLIGIIVKIFRRDK